MKVAFVPLAAALGCAIAAAQPRVFTGVISESMCGRDHAAMKISPESKCVTECARASGVRYVLVAGKEIFTLSDQKTPARFAARKVSVKGVLDSKTRTIAVESIEAAK